MLISIECFSSTRVEAQAVSLAKMSLPLLTAKAIGDISSRTALSKIRLQNSHSVVHGIISLALLG